MNKDIRISVDFFEHHKTRRLKRRLGWEGVIALQQLWCYAAKHRPQGSLNGMDAEDIADASKWEGEPKEFVSQLCEIGFLEECDKGTYLLHDWEENNPWAAAAQERSEKARKAARAKHAKEKSSENNAEGVPNACDEHGGSMREAGSAHALGREEHAQCSAPSPSPSPSPPPDGSTEYPSSDEEGGAAFHNEGSTFESNQTPTSQELLNRIQSQAVRDLVEKSIDLIAMTRKSGKIAESVLCRYLSQILQYEEWKIGTAITIYLSREYWLDKKGEKYLLGILRRVTSRDYQDVVGCPEPSKENHESDPGPRDSPGEIHPRSFAQAESAERRTMARWLLSQQKGGHDAEQGVVATRADQTVDRLSCG